MIVKKNKYQKEWHMRNNAHATKSLKLDYYIGELAPTTNHNHKRKSMSDFFLQNFTDLFKETRYSPKRNLPRGP
jgi:hypothetical protein